MRIYDNPNHPQYGPVRRTWVVLSQLDLLDAAERYRTASGERWDEAVAEGVSLGLKEPNVQKTILYTLMEGWC